MRGASRESLKQAEESLAVLTAVPATDVTALSDDLAAIGSLLDRDVSLRRLLSDPSRPGEERARLVAALLGGKVGEQTVDLVSGMVRGRWAQPRDLADAVDVLATEAELALAERAGALDAVEDDLFRFGRILAAEPELVSGLSERIPAGQRTALIDSLLAGKANPSAIRLIRRLVAAPRRRSVVAGVEELSRIAAARRERVTALVTAAIPLTEAQRSRLTGILSRSYGREVRLNVELDQELIGGMVIRVGDDIIDGSIAGRLAEAARRVSS
ncbi:MAG TPA: F0F1 ATP synthase subunit delta [Actinocrinis sp.]|jgi:F-type H+-transporting ATPase subunit delta|uniref:F0F1 ATP synthase subunit delta n=1 Tax=Actinocrinis sp. TaxID=1920516 RepID=UPI002DDD5F94|nr:F0F1 ATP synthase subunit delta [Actinocrinis sp.]HEV3171743.1 F0F1 ATP synthase subunit delta [Actinocrinis sp.]